MPVYRIILFRLKPDVTEQQKTSFVDGAKAIREKVPGVVSIEVGPPLDMARTKGFDMGIFMVLETKEHLKTFAEHPAHLLLHDMRESMSDDSLAFNLPF